MSRVTTIPGLKCCHQVISPICRKNHGFSSAGLIAMENIKDAYEEYVRSEGSENVTWHIVLIREDKL